MSVLTARQSVALHRIFWCGAISVSLVGMALTKAETLQQVLVGLLVMSLALFPSYLWVMRRVPGWPLFPVLAITYGWTVALPLWSQPTALTAYSPEAQVEGGLTVAGFLLVATVTWLVIVQKPTPPPTELYMLEEGTGTRIFLTCLAGCCIFEAALRGDWFVLPSGLVSIARATSISLSVLAIAVLAYYLGEGRLNRQEGLFFQILLVFFMVANAVSLLLVGAMIIGFVAIIMHSMACGRLPVVWTVTLFGVFSILHLGKAEMRSKYWSPWQPLQPRQYPSFLVEWTGYAMQRFSFGGQGDEATSDQQDIFERASLLQMLLLVQKRSPEELPYLAGETYALVPQLLIPRILAPDKFRSHEGTYRLAIYYGLQTEEATFRTTIGFGLLSEGYANFGWAGVLFLALGLGAGTGFVTRWSQHAPILSFRGLTAMTIIPAMVQAEYTAGVLVTSLFQSMVVLLGLTAAMMHVRPLKPVPRGPITPVSLPGCVP